MIPANMSTTPIACKFCRKTVSYPFYNQKFCNLVCRDRYNHASHKKGKNNGALAKQTHSIKGVNFGSHNIVGANTMGAFDPEDVAEIWHEPESWPTRTSAGRPICPRCGSELQPNEVKFCGWCVRDRQRFLDRQAKTVAPTTGDEITDKIMTGSHITD
jgi:uncharacterized CHY-type Zn-finger protein